MNKSAFGRVKLAFFGLVLFAVLPQTAFTIDNPDSADYVAIFRAKVQKYESELSESAGNNKAFAATANRYEKFLDEELNIAYRQLLTKISDKQKVQLLESQKAWLKYRDDEGEFIDGNWNPQNFGSSSLISQHMYKESIVRNRVEQLLHYFKNY